MKKILTIVLAVLLLDSCSKMLEEHPRAIASETFYKTPDEVVDAVNSAYASLLEGGYTTYFTNLAACADNVYAKGSLAIIDEYQGFSTSNITNMGGVWKQLYLAIRNANLVISNLAKNTNLPDDQKRQFIGEVKFVRAFCYFNLVRLWAGVPLRTEDNMDEIDLKRSSKDEVYDLIVSDLKFAEENLPDAPRMLGTASKWVAKTVLADVYLTQENWAKSMEEAGDVIASGKFSLVKVSTPEDFEKIYGADVLTSSEEIFYFKYNSQHSWSLMSFFHHDGDGYYPHGPNYFAFYTTSDNYFYEHWDNNDLRKQHDFYKWDIGLGDNTFLFRKYVDQDGSTPPSNDWPIYRYAEVLLIYAEAADRAEKGPTPEAVECLNKVHRRAYGYDPDAPSPVDFNMVNYNEESFFNLVFREKGYETILECKRWLDLLRTHQAASMIKKTLNIDVDTAMYLFPIPITETDFNKAIDPVKDQNPGY